ncbi:ABC transporter substrate-binding protein [Dehalococcoidia bacterium]|nr:ABC transporter substrate-binding protein [Dehalococcoidia bacterium]
MKLGVNTVTPLAVAFLLFFTVTACDGQDISESEESQGKVVSNVNLALDWYPNSNHSGFYMAKEGGHYIESSLSVNIFTPANPEDVLKTVGAGKDDFGVSYQAEVLLARAQGIPVKSIAAMVQHPLNSIMVLKDSGISRPSHLVGKKIGVTGIPFEEALFSAMLEYDGIKPEDVTIVNVGFDLGPALLGGKVDAIVGAYWTHESIAMESQGYEIGVLRMEDWGVPDFYELVLVTSEETLENRPDLVKTFLSATKKGFLEAGDDPVKAVDVLVGFNPEVDRDLEIKGIGLLVPLWSEDGVEFGTQNADIWEQLSTWMKQKGLLEDHVDYQKAFTTEFIE